MKKPITVLLLLLLLLLSGTPALAGSASGMGADTEKTLNAGPVLVSLAKEVVAMSGILVLTGKDLTGPEGVWVQETDAQNREHLFEYCLPFARLTESEIWIDMNGFREVKEAGQAKGDPGDRDGATGWRASLPPGPATLVLKFRSDAPEGQAGPLLPGAAGETPGGVKLDFIIASGAEAHHALVVALGVVVLCFLVLPWIIFRKESCAFPVKQPFWRSWLRLLVTEKNELSLARTQMYIWTILAILTYVFEVVFQNNYLYDVPATLIVLMGFGGSTLGLGALIDRYLPGKVYPVQDRPQLEDLLEDEDGHLTLWRYQVLVWTVVSVWVFLWQFFSRFQTPGIPNTLLTLQGISNGIYLLAKVSEKKASNEVDSVPDSGNNSASYTQAGGTQMVPGKEEVEV